MVRFRLLFLLTLAALLVVPLLAPSAPAEAGTCFTGYTTGPGASAWGKGTTCNNARGNLQGQLIDQADAICVASSFTSSCNITFVETSGCYFDYGYNKWIIDGYANFGCEGLGPDTRN